MALREKPPGFTSVAWLWSTFFSGYRRQHDIHHILDQHVHRTGAHVCTISVDLCLQRQHTDLATHQSVHWWTARIRAGQVISAGGGPPCETFSVARTQNDGGPRQLRSRNHPHGTPGLRMKEWRQLRIGDQLLRFMVEILIVLAQCGYSGFLEHPQYPTWKLDGDVASIWALEIIRVLKKLHCVTIVSFDQCVCGALGRKPTTLLLLRLPEVRHNLLLKGQWGRCNHAPDVHGPLIGKQADGSFNTAKAKIYPVALNRVLADAMFRFVLEFMDCNITHELPGDFQAYQADGFVERATVQPDYYPAAPS